MQVLNALPSCLSWIRFALCHRLGSSCRTDALQFCLLDLLHKGLCSTLTGSRWLVERKKTTMVLYFFDCLQILVVYCLQLDVQKRQGWRYPCSLPSCVTQMQTLMHQDLCFLQRLGMLTPWSMGELGWLITSFPLPFSHDFLLLLKLWTMWVSLAVYHVRSQQPWRTP